LFEVVDACLSLVVKDVHATTFGASVDLSVGNIPTPINFSIEGDGDVLNEMNVDEEKHCQGRV